MREIGPLVRLCLREVGSFPALNFKSHTSASDSDAICNSALKSEVDKILSPVACTTFRAFLVFVPVHIAVSWETKHIWMQIITSSFLLFSSELHTGRRNL